MRTLIYFIILLAPSTIGIAAESKIQLTGAHDRVLLAVPDNWTFYGPAGLQTISGISLTPKRPTTEGNPNYPTVSIRADVHPPGSCSASDKLVKSELTKFDQRQVSSPENILIQGKQATIIHTQNDLADYLNVCVTLKKDRVFLILTVSSGSPPTVLQQYKKDFVWVLQHLDAKDKDEAPKG